jgi:hypothetical protein
MGAEGTSDDAIRQPEVISAQLFVLPVTKHAPNPNSMPPT